jgi:hypothetical protein
MSQKAGPTSRRRQPPPPNPLPPKRGERESIRSTNGTYDRTPYNVAEINLARPHCQTTGHT